MRRIITLTEKDIDSIVTVNGWVETARFQKRFVFLKIYDSWKSHLQPLQVIFEEDNITDELLKLTTGDSVKIYGKIVKSPKELQPIELYGLSLEVIGKVKDPSTYPIAKTNLTLEHLRTYPHLECFSATKSAIYGIRSLLMEGIESFFKEYDFTRTDMPLITFSECEGGCQPMQATLLLQSNELKDIPSASGKVDFSKDFFGKKASLTVSSQLELETHIPLGNVWTVTRAVRGEPSATARHLAEFSMVELEMPFINSSTDVSKISEELIKYAIRYVIQDKYGLIALKCLEQKLQKDILLKLNKYLESDFVVITHRDAVKMMKTEEESGNVKFETPPSYSDDMSSEHEKFLTDFYKVPVIIKYYPKNVKAFYMPVIGSFVENEKEIEYVDCFDLIVPGVGELVGGSARIHSEFELGERIENLQLEKEPLEFYMDLRRNGSVTHGGMGMGFERLVKFVTGAESVKDCVPYPRYYRSEK